MVFFKVKFLPSIVFGLINNGVFNDNVMPFQW